MWFLVWCVGRGGQVMDTDLCEGPELYEQHMRDCGWERHRVYIEVLRT